MAELTARKRDATPKSEFGLSIAIIIAAHSATERPIGSWTGR